jgi:hypothetical protein
MQMILCKTVERNTCTFCEPPHPPSPRDLSHATAAQRLSKYDKRIQEHEEKLRDKLVALSAKHQRELDAFESEWREVMSDRYRCRSTLLMELQQNAHSLAVGNKFENAQARKEETGNQANKELRLSIDYQNAQHEEGNQVQETALEQRELLLTLRTATEQAFANRIIVLDTKRQF